MNYIKEHEHGGKVVGNLFPCYQKVSMSCFHGGAQCHWISHTIFFSSWDKYGKDLELYFKCMLYFQEKILLLMSWKDTESWMIACNMLSIHISALMFLRFVVITSSDSEFFNSIASAHLRYMFLNGPTSFKLSTWQQIHVKYLWNIKKSKCWLSVIGVCYLHIPAIYLL